MIHAWIILGTLVPFFIIFATLPHIEHAPPKPKPKVRARRHSTKPLSLQ
jgi:hypothetical protein